MVIIIIVLPIRICLDSEGFTLGLYCIFCLIHDEKRKLYGERLAVTIVICTNISDVVGTS